ncbi:MAG: restriction endonuclease subunit S [Firmicutes bacterium]|jgi:type I restriction enzyme S subunit|nr:restriction endonuclease subunit S [Bacillota bacterium]
MDTKALRQKILDLAIRGKLVPQDPNDEPASILLERIREQKIQMVKDGRLKKKDIKNDSIIFVGEDSSHYEKFADGSVKCIEEEIPFELPEGWSWERLCNIASFSGGKTPSTSCQEYWGNAHLWITSKDMKSKYITSSLTKLSDEGSAIMQMYPSNTLLIVTRSGILKHTLPVAILKVPATINQDLKAISLYEPILAEHIYNCIKGMENRLLSLYTKSGTTVENVNFDEFKKVLLPIAPYGETVRIIKAIERFCEIVYYIEHEKDKLSNIITKTKSKILDLAIRGQLVPQNPDDEPASVLLDRIRAEKEELIKQGKIKRDKKESVIFRGEDNSYYEKIGDEIICIDEELPYKVPDTWEWIRLENCCVKEIKRGKAPKYVDHSNTLVFAQKCNTKYNGIDIGLALYLDEDKLNKYAHDEYMQDGDIVINSTGAGTLGRVGYYQKEDNLLGLPIVPDSHVTVVRAFNNLLSFYLYLYMKANQNALEVKGEGSTNQKELKPSTLKEMFVPIPPYLEQTQIIKKTTALLNSLSNIEASLR